ncbi:hypothetical protein Gogos_022030, partial [Gossypium gossypioides]|nr:hypothetical protein [Gossypium gossypioides]
CCSVTFSECSNLLAVFLFFCFDFIGFLLCKFVLLLPLFQHFHNDGCWEGAITKELENGNFHVYFKKSKEQLEFREDKLRLHREWLNGSWVPPLKEAEQVQEVNSIVSLGFF